MPMVGTPPAAVSPGQSLRARKAGLAGSLAHPFLRKGEAVLACGKRSSPPATLTLGRKHMKDFVGATSQ